MSDVAKLTIDGQTYEYPIVTGTEGRARDRHLQAPHRDRATSPSIRATPTPAPAAARSPSSTARRASCATAAIPSRSSPSSSTFLEVAYLLIYGELPTKERARGLQRTTSPTTRCSTRTFALHFRRFPPTRIPWRSFRRSMGALSTFYPDCLDPSDPRAGPVERHPPDGQAADHRGLCLQAQSCGQPFIYPRTSSTTRATSCT